MESVTLVGMRPRAVGNPIENLCAVVGSAGDGNVDSNRLPMLSATTGVSATGVPPSSTTSVPTKVQQMYDDPDPLDRNLPKHPHGNEFDRDDILAQNPMVKPAPTRLPAIQNGGGSKSDLTTGVVPVKRSATSATVPLSPDTAMKLYMHKLSAFEQHEIFDYPKVSINQSISQFNSNLVTREPSGIATVGGLGGGTGRVPPHLSQGLIVGFVQIR